MSRLNPEYVTFSAGLYSKFTFPDSLVLSSYLDCVQDGKLHVIGYKNLVLQNIKGFVVVDSLNIIVAKQTTTNSMHFALTTKQLYSTFPSGTMIFTLDTDTVEQGEMIPEFLQACTVKKIIATHENEFQQNFSWDDYKSLLRFFQTSPHANATLDQRDDEHETDLMNIMQPAVVNNITMFNLELLLLDSILMHQAIN